MKPLLPFIIDIDYRLLNTIFTKESNNFKVYSDYRGIIGEKWQINKLQKKYIYIYEIMNKLQINGRPRFYILKANTKLGNHVDNGTLCSINFLLNTENAPITILDKDYNYKNALIDTTKMHGVDNSKSKLDRRIFKISIFEKTYEQTVSHFKNLAKNNIIRLL